MGLGPGISVDVLRVLGFLGSGFRVWFAELGRGFRVEGLGVAGLKMGPQPRALRLPGFRA